MQKTFAVFIIFSFLFYPSLTGFGQSIKDSVVVVNKHKDSVKNFNPRTAAIRSALLPGLGQVYNKKYWKVPIIYAALGITGGIFIYNVKTYKKLRDAYINKVDGDDTNNYLIDPRYFNLSVESLRSYRNTFRQNIDYSALVFIVFWGLNVVDASVDAHLKSFDVSDDLQVQVKAGYSELAHTNGLGIVMNIGKRYNR